MFLSPKYTYTFDFQKRPSHIGKCNPIYVLKPSQNISKGRLLGRNWTKKSLKSFPPCNSQSPLLTDFTLPSPLSKSGLKLVCKVNIVYRNHKSDNSQDYAQKPQRNCTFMNSVSGATYVRTYLPKSLIPTQHLYASIPYIRSTCTSRRNLSCILGWICIEKF